MRIFMVSPIPSSYEKQQPQLQRTFRMTTLVSNHMGNSELHNHRLLQDGQIQLQFTNVQLDEPMPLETKVWCANINVCPIIVVSFRFKSSKELITANC